MSKATKQSFSVFHDADEAFLKSWHRPYASLFQGSRRVLDIGSGLMYFGELLREAGVEVIGLDLDPQMVKVGQDKGFEVIFGDHRALQTLGRTVDGVHISHVVEHVWGDELIDLLQTSITCLNPGGLLIIRTPNWSVRFVREHLFWMDHTHKRPYPRQLLAKILSDLGMSVVDSGEEPYGVRDLYVIAQRPGDNVATIPNIQFPPQAKRTLAIKISTRIKTYLRRFLDLE